MDYAIANTKTIPDKEGWDQGGKTPADDHCRESHFQVQTRSSDTCPPQPFHVINQNVQGHKGKDKLENIIEVIIQKAFTLTAFKRRGSSGRFTKESKGPYCYITAWQQIRATEVERFAVSLLS